MDTTEANESGQSPVRVIKKKRRDIPAEEKKICLWVLEDGTACGKTFTKFDRYIFHFLVEMENYQLKLRYQLLYFEHFLIFHFQLETARF